MRRLPSQARCPTHRPACEAAGGGAHCRGAHLACPGAALAQAPPAVTKQKQTYCESRDVVAKSRQAGLHARLHAESRVAAWKAARRARACSYGADSHAQAHTADSTRWWRVHTEKASPPTTAATENTAIRSARPIVFVKELPRHFPDHALDWNRPRQNLMELEKKNKPHTSHFGRTSARKQMTYCVR